MESKEDKIVEYLKERIERYPPEYTLLEGLWNVLNKTFSSISSEYKENFTNTLMRFLEENSEWECYLKDNENS